MGLHQMLTGLGAGVRNIDPALPATNCAAPAWRFDTGSSDSLVFDEIEASGNEPVEEAASRSCSKCILYPAAFILFPKRV